MAEMAKEMANSVETLPSVSYRIQLQNRLYSERGKAGRNVEQAKAFRAAEQLRNRQSKTRKKEETPAAQQRVQTDREGRCNLDGGGTSM